MKEGFDYQPWSPPFWYDEMGSKIMDSLNRMVLDVRGWGFLTGTGGGLAMSHEKASDIQHRLGHHVVMLMNGAGSEHARVELHSKEWTVVKFTEEGRHHWEIRCKERLICSFPTEREANETADAHNVTLTLHGDKIIHELEKQVCFYSMEGREQRPDMIEWRKLADKRRRTKAEQARLDGICRAVMDEDMDALERLEEIRNLRAEIKRLSLPKPSEERDTDLGDKGAV